MRPRHYVGFSIALVALGLVALALALNRSRQPDQVAIAHLFSKTKTVCVGRFLLDLPEDVRVEFSGVDVDAFKIAAFHETSEAFEARLAEREAQIRAMPDRNGRSRNLELTEDVKTRNGLFGKLFVHNRNVMDGTRANGLRLERYRYEDVTAEALVHGDGVSIDVLSERRDPKYIKDLPALLDQLVANPHNVPTSEPGFCIDNAYLRDPLTAEQGERLTLFASLPRHPDIEIMLILAAGLKPDEQGLLERSRSADNGLSFSQRMRISTLRASPREIAGLPGEELIERFVEENNVQVHSFWWEAKGTEDNVLSPHFVLRMNTGKSGPEQVPSSLSDAAALGLWDKLSSSIRLRSSTAAQPSQRPCIANLQQAKKEHP